VKDRERSALEQLQTLRAVLDAGVITDYSTAIDGGAHRGDWSRMMATRFATVYAFEPSADTFELLKTNTANLANVEARRQALYSHACRVQIRQPAKRQASTARYVREVFTARADADAVTIDSQALERCGLIKLDLEGAEFFALQGAAATLARCRPVLIVEHYKALSEHHFGVERRAISKAITAHGYRCVLEAAPDFVYVRS
jgi:FkbM family methyltransferase